ncbi:MAG: TPM domain-containing protein [Bacteroidales bacterium]|nr:TPM domain-containing protein [Bacteroidales bacterium]
MKKTYILLLTALLTAVSVAYGTDVPYLTGRVNDNAQIISESTRKTLTETLKEHEARTTNQIVILTISSLEGESIEDYANKVFNEWKLGQKGKDNGILMVVVPQERRMRIEVGYGLESTMTDLSASRIIREIITPRFRDRDYDGGISEGALAIISILDGKALPQAEEVNEQDSSSGQSNFSDIDKPDMPLTTRILIGAFIFGIIGLFTFLGIITPGVGWFLYFFLIPFWAMFPIMVVGTHGALICLVTYLIVYPVSKLIIGKKAWYKKAKTDLRTKGKASIGGFVVTSGGSGSSWSSGSSGSGGGFSGGGGSSGGGGASGSW